MKKLLPLDLYAGDTADRNSTNFPKRPNSLGYVDTEADVLYVHVDGSWHGLGSPGIPEPDNDSVTYLRQTAAGVSSWVAGVPKAGGTFTGAVAISSGGLTVEGGAVFNESGAGVVHRFEGDGNANLVYIDGVNDRFGVGITPAVPLHSFGVVRHEFSTGQYMAITDTGISGLRLAARNSSANLDQFTLSGDQVIIAAGIGSGNGSGVVNALYDGSLKLGFFGATPVVQQTAVKATTALQNLGLGTSLTDYVAATGGTFSGAVAISSGGLTVTGGSTLNGHVGINTAADATYYLYVVSSGANSLFERSSATDAGINVFYNPNTTDGNSAIISFATDTTSTGATAQKAGVQLRSYFTAHDDATYTTRLDFWTRQSGSFANRLSIGAGVVVGSPTGGDKGAGTINATAVYDDNTLLSDHILDLHYDGRMRQSDAERFPKARLWNIEQTAVFTKQNRHLPTMPGRAEWESSGSKSLGKMITALWETVEQQQIMIFELNDKLKAVTNG